MKTLQLLFLSLVLFSCSSTNPVSVQSFSGNIENNSEYFGEANPPDIILYALLEYKPSSNQVFYVRNALNYLPYTSTLTSFTTNVAGNYTLNLPSGNYAIISKEKYDYEQNPEVPTDCEFLKTPDFLLTISPNQQNYSSQYTTRKLNYCLPIPN
jgi:hypothetical protein